METYAKNRDLTIVEHSDTTPWRNNGVRCNDYVFFLE